MSNNIVEVRGVRVAARSHIIVGDQIEIVADEAAVNMLGGADSSRHDEQLRAMGHRFIETHRLLGLDVEGLKRIIVSGRKPTDSLDLVVTTCI